VSTLGEALRQNVNHPDGPESLVDLSDVDVPTTEAALAAASAAGDADAFVRALLDAAVLVPTGRAVDAAEILDADFPWLVSGPASSPNIGVFTSVEALERAHDVVPPFVVVAFTFLAALWPEPYTLVVNPGGATSVSLPGDQVGLLPLWRTSLPVD
jgi:hypothetical protein